MKTRKMVLAAAVGLVGFGLAQTTQAGRVNDIIGGLGLPALIGFDDDDASEIVDANSNTVLDAGDVLRGVIRIQRIFRLFPPGGSVDIPQGVVHSEMTGLYQLRVAAATVGTSYVFEPDPAFDTTLDAILGPGTHTGAMVALWDDTSPNFDFTLATEAAVRATAFDGDLWGIFGFAGSGTEFFTTTTAGTSIAAATAAPAQGTGFAAFGTGGFSLSQISGTGGLVNNLGMALNGFGTHLLGSYALYGKDADPFTSGTQHIYPAFDVTSDADFSINIIPLPASAFMGMGLMAALGVARIVRRRA
jgi:hypothetical protein